jgi:hypothetical protein
MKPSFKLNKKCWEVVDPTAEVWNSNYYGNEPVPDYVYADTRSEAKYQCSEKTEFINIKAKRYKNMDKVLFEGHEMKRSQMNYTIEQRKIKAKILEKLNDLPDDELFYVQDARSYVGNSPLWWGLNNNGYVCELSKAQKYTKEEILQYFNPPRETDRIWLASHVETATKVIVDAQNLNYSYQLI